jgi:hypothetical protein
MYGFTNPDGDRVDPVLDPLLVDSPKKGVVKISQTFKHCQKGQTHVAKLHNPSPSSGEQDLN